MLRFLSHVRRSNGALSRREWLLLGGLAGLGFTLPGRKLAASQSRNPDGFGKAKSVLLIYAGGGQSQIDTWDLKPEAPAEIRGEFRPIRTSVPGTLVCEHMPRVARLAKLYTILRSVSHEDTDHGSATYLALTGQYHAQKSANPPPRPTDLPTYGAVLKRVRPAERYPHTAVHLNGPVLAPEIPAPGQFAGFLAGGCEPLLLGDVREAAESLRALEPRPDLPAVRLESRRTLLHSIESQVGRWQQDKTLLEKDVLFRQAYQFLSAPRCRSAFDLAQEPERVRDRYGRHRSGQACLLARRLVEAGVPFVTVFLNHTIRGQDKAPDQPDMYGWDTHNDIFSALKDHLLPTFDESFSALLEDLDQRGLLDTTLVVCMGEFGRAPRVALEPTFAGSSPGRKHWSAVYSVVLAGAGVTKGAVVGASDRHGAYPQITPVGPWDIAATIFAALGIDPAGHYEDLAAQPFPVTRGKPIREIYM
jgi:hypothetical protein